MKNLILVKGRTYTRKGFTCSNGTPFFVENDELAESLLATGRFQNIPIEVNDGEQADNNAEEPGLPSAEEQNTPSADDIAKMKKEELIAFAAKHDIDISDCNTNKEKIERIQGMLGVASFTSMGLED